jgi:hypothetical protein
MVVLAGNMRLKAAMEIGLSKIPTIIATELTEEEQRELVVKDNIGYGEWDWDILANEWDKEQLEDWGLDIKIDAFVGTEDEDDTIPTPKATDDGYSVFELVMLHENKLQLLDTLNSVKNNYLFEKQEDALMEILRVYNQKQ